MTQLILDILCLSGVAFWVNATVWLISISRHPKQDDWQHIANLSNSELLIRYQNLTQNLDATARAYYQAGMLKSAHKAYNDLEWAQDQVHKLQDRIRLTSDRQFSGGGAQHG